MRSQPDARSKKLLKRCKGFYGDRKNHLKLSKDALMSALAFNYKHRKLRKRDFRSLWIMRIGVAAKINGMSYSKLINGLKRHGLRDQPEMVLAELAIRDPGAFTAIAATAKQGLEQLQARDPMASLPEQIGRTPFPFHARAEGGLFYQRPREHQGQISWKERAYSSSHDGAEALHARRRPHMGKLINDLKEELVSHCDHSLGPPQTAGDERAASKKNGSMPPFPAAARFLGRVHPINQMMQPDHRYSHRHGFFRPTWARRRHRLLQFRRAQFRAGPSRPRHARHFLSQRTADLLLRTHTSNVQVHAMENHSPPIRIIAPGAVSATRIFRPAPMFFSIKSKGFTSTKSVTFADLLSTMDEFFHKLLGEKVKTRFRPSYFPFVEPGMEVDVRCTACKGRDAAFANIPAGWRSSAQA